MAVSPGEPARPLRIAIVAPLVTTISEPQQGGSQVMVADLAVGLTQRGHDVDVYAATGSLITGAHVIETGIDSASLSAALIRPGQPRHPLRALDDAYEHVFEMVGRGGYDVVHSHGFDPPALRRARAGRARVIHTVHLPPEPEAADALREAQGASEPAIVVGVSVAQARAWSPLIAFDRVIRNGVPVEPHPVVRPAGRRAGLRRSAQRREGCGRRHRDRAAGRGADRPLRGRLRRGLCPRPPTAPRGRSRRHLSRTADPDGAVAEARFGSGGPVSERLGRALRPGRGRGAGGRHAGRRLRARRIDRDHRRRGHRLPRRAGKRGGSGRGRAVRGELDRRRCRQHAVDDLDLEACLVGLRGPLRFGRGASCADRRPREQRIGGHPVDLPKHPVVHGHPIHAILSDGPVVLIPLAIVGRSVESEGARPRDPAR